MPSGNSTRLVTAGRQREGLERSERENIGMTRPGAGGTSGGACRPAAVRGSERLLLPVPQRAPKIS